MRSAFYVFIRTLLYIPAKLIFRVHVKGRENEPRRIEGPYLVCANHQTVLDVIFLALALRHQQPHFMAKEGVFRVPVLRRLVKWLGAFPVARGRADVGAVKHSINLLKSGRTVGIFPQGTRCAGKALRDTSPKGGAGLIASRAGVQILPIFIQMKNQKWRFLRRVNVVIGKPITVEEIAFDENAKGEAMRISELAFDRICAMSEAVQCAK